MPLFNIAIKNVEKNFKNYMLYIISMVFSIAIFFVFKSIEYNKTVVDFLSSSSKIESAFKAASVVMLMFSMLFIMYSNGFFLRKRKKEIGLYSLLGIENKSIAMLLFFETLLIGIVSLILAITLGVAIANIFTKILIKLIGIKLAIEFTISFKAIAATINAFLVVFIVVSFKAYRVIYKYELIDLFKAQSVKEKEPKSSKFLALVSIVMIIGGYINYLTLLKSAGDLFLTLITTLVLVVGGTFLFFNTFLVFIIKKKRNYKNYFRGLNMIATSQLIYRIKGNAKTLAIISVLSATTITAVGVTFSYNVRFVDTIKKEMDVSYVTKIDDSKLHSDILSAIKEDKDVKLISSGKFNLIDMEISKGKGSKDTTEFKDYFEVMSETQFRELKKLKGDNTKFEALKDSEVEIFGIFDEEKKSLKGISSTIFNDDKIYTIRDGSENLLLNTRGKKYIVNDNVYNKLKPLGKINTYNAYNLENEKNMKNLNEKLRTLVGESAKRNNLKLPSSLHYASFYEVYEENSVSIGTLMFIGAFMGLVFLICTGSIIFFKQVSEANEEKYRYYMLQKIGVDNDEIKQSIYKQMMYIFFIPLSIGIMHSTVAVNLMTTAFKQNLGYILMVVLIPYILVYTFYYLITSRYYFKIVIKN